MSAEIISALINGAWRPRPLKNGEIYDFMDGYDACVYSDWKYPKGEHATYEIKVVDEKNFLEIKHSRNPIEPEVYEIIEIGDEEMIWEYSVSKDKKERINLKRFYLDGKPSKDDL